MANTGWDSTNYEELSPINEDECREQCMNDCNCAVAIIRDGTCWKKKIPLSHGQRNPQVRGKALIKVAKGNWSFYPSQVTQGKKRDRSSMILIGSLLLGSSVFLNFIFLLAIPVAAFSQYSRRKQRHQQELGTLGMNLRSFTYRELEQVTEGFKITLGRGAFGIVYKGVLVASNSRDFIAVKKLNEVEKDNEEEFRTEVMAIGQTHHRNLVHLIGFCDEGPHRLLVYELMSNGSLASFIFGSSKPDWNQRKQIVLGIARGLLYLHEECNTQIIHCDIKPQNILLDDCYTARISDFGLAKLLKADQTRTMTNIRGTKGYVAPEWFRKTAITAKVDVYSFGVMLLEIICCRRNIKLEPENRGVAILMDWAWDCYKERRLDLLMEGGQDALSDIKRLERFVMVAFWCVQDDPSQRPTMKTVTQMLEGTIDVSVPPDPFSSSSLG